VTDPVRVAVNGFGRIGRTFVRAAWGPDAAGAGAVDVVAANDVQSPDQLAYLFEHDSVAGRWPDPVVFDGDALVAGARSLRLLRVETPEALPWAAMGVDVVIESSRRFAAAEQARRHLDAGARLVIVSAPSTGADATFVVGVNDHTFDPAQHRVVSNASCTTNCLAPMAAVLHDAFGIREGVATTVHAYTSDQAIVDGAAAGGSWRDARAAAVNVIPTTTGAARAIGLVLPELAGRLHGSSLRVPVPNGSIVDLAATLDRRVNVDEVNAAFRSAAASGPLAGVLEYSDDALVSSDIVGRSASCIFDSELTVATDTMVKIFGWYDNEWGYSNRLVDLAVTLGRRLGR
jgi:glyceraldehyde 3-phosphate dehydrogenase